ncbi:AAA family ATPase [Blastococcus sp. TF02A-26]|uniref:AAA family ATPase n=1 Tax=Blastococcus sp. TF02A-26 TaxID=2250577 RepID=UPI000DEB8B64|nr:AAA family ATPase [Blastococcus sp. TF02A-26]RBY84320.1 ATPase [Blastococcus sp. TF02A-26]
MSASFRDNLDQMLKARFPLLYVESFEELRVVTETVHVASALRTPRGVWSWSVTEGLTSPAGAVQANTRDAAAALDAVTRIEEPALFLFRDLHAVLGDGSRPADQNVVRRLRDVAASFKNGATPRTLMVVAPLLRIPPELEKDVTLLDFPLPGEFEIRQLLDNMILTNSVDGRIKVQLEERDRERLAKAAQGLTLGEAENAFARAMVNDGKLTPDDVDVVLEEKRQTIRKSGLLEFVPVDVELSDVGGLENLKRWLAKRSDSWLAEAAEYGLPAPKGVLITGVPGCGKSLTAKAIASAWGLPLLRMDIGRVFAGLVGSSEQNMRTGIATAEATSPCVLWIDEIEKGFAGVGGGGDSGTSSRVFGSFLTWMQEKSRPVFVIATANNIDRLPPEFLRKGRFDEIFFVDLPTTAERAAIWRIQLKKRVRSADVRNGLEGDTALLADLAASSEGYSGAEIEQAVTAGLFDAFADRRPLKGTDLQRALRNMVPLSITQAEQIQAVREWADVRAVAASAPSDDAVRPVLSPPAVAVPPPPTARGGRFVDF